jgi:hypothetical protein
MVGLHDLPHKIEIYSMINNCLLSWNRKFISMFTEPHLDPVVRKLDELYTSMSYFSKINFNIFLLSTSISHKLSMKLTINASKWLTCRLGEWIRASRLIRYSSIRKSQCYETEDSSTPPTKPVIGPCYKPCECSSPRNLFMMNHFNTILLPGSRYP